MKEIKFNINDYVKIKLNPSGVKVLRQNHERIFGSELLKKYPFKEPQKDKHGYSEFQMWHFMDEFGNMSMGSFNQLQPYETNIIICLPTK